MMRTGNFHNEVYDGYKARIIQHEYDHLEGILFTDQVSPLRKRLIKRKLTEISKGKFEAEYRTILLLRDKVIIKSGSPKSCGSYLSVP